MRKAGRVMSCHSGRRKVNTFHANRRMSLTETAHRSGPTKRKRHWSLSLIQIVAIAYAGLLIALVAMESRLVFPGAYLRAGSDRPTISQPWEYPAIDGTAITGQLIQRPGARRTVLYFHGNGLTAAMTDGWIVRLSEHLNANVLAAEYRGFQVDSVTPHESNLIDDSLAAHDAVCQHFSLQPQELIVYGRSLGGGCAAAVAAQRPTRTLILDRTFDSVADVAAARYPIFPVRWLMKNHFDSVQRLLPYEGTVIQIHGTTDTDVPLAHGKRLHDSISTANKIFLEIPGMGHNDRLSDEILDQVCELLDRSN